MKRWFSIASLKRWLPIAALGWVVLVGLPSIPAVRGDLYHMHRVPRIIFQRSDEWSSYVFGTLAEARNVKQTLPSDVRTLVLVSSAPHMRRSVLTFRRVLPADVPVVPYAAGDFASSAELYRPIWVEYLKLAVYSFVAWR